MKNQLKIFTCFLVSLILICINPNKALSQFNAASVTDINMGTGIDPSHNSGNDVGEFLGERFEVTVADWPDNPIVGGLTYSISGASPLFINFSYSADGYLDPDVCLVANGTDVFALAVYLAYVPNGGNFDNLYVLECFKFDWISYQFNSVGTTQFDAYDYNSAIPSSYDFEVNIDADVLENRRFVITWDDYTMNYVYAKGGELPDKTDDCVNLCENTTVVYDAGAVGNAATEHPMPDVAYNGTNIFFVYLISAYEYTPFGPSYWERIQVASINAEGNLCIESPDISVVYTSMNSAFDNYDNPRIACPNTSTSAYGANMDDWHVVASETDFASVFGIMGINYYNGTGFNILHYYNDGICPNSPYDITTYPNYEPVVTYTEDGSILVGWLFDNVTYGTLSTSAEIDANYPIVLNCDAKGDIIAYANYMNVPTSSVSSNDNCGSLSMAGRNCFCGSTSGRSNLFSWSVDGQDIFTKLVPEGNTALRLAKNGNEKPNLNSLLYSSAISNSIDIEKIFEFKIYDVMGKQILSFVGNILSIQGEYKRLTPLLSSGVYLGQIECQDASIAITGKLLIANNN